MKSCGTPLQTAREIIFEVRNSNQGWLWFTERLSAGPRCGPGGRCGLPTIPCFLKKLPPQYYLRLQHCLAMRKQTWRLYRKR